MESADNLMWRIKLEPDKGGILIRSGLALQGGHLAGWASEVMTQAGQVLRLSSQDSGALFRLCSTLVGCFPRASLDLQLS